MPLARQFDLPVEIPFAPLGWDRIDLDATGAVGPTKAGPFLGGGERHKRQTSQRSSEIVPHGGNPQEGGVGGTCSCMVTQRGMGIQQGEGVKAVSAMARRGKERGD